MGLEAPEQWLYTPMRGIHATPNGEGVKKVFFFYFLFSQSQVYGYQHVPLTLVVVWVPLMGVYNMF